MLELCIPAGSLPFRRLAPQRMQCGGFTVFLVVILTDSKLKGKRKMKFFIFFCQMP